MHHDSVDRKTRGGNKDLGTISDINKRYKHTTYVTSTCTSKVASMSDERKIGKIKLTEMAPCIYEEIQAAENGLTHLREEYGGQEEGRPGHPRRRCHSHIPDSTSSRRWPKRFR